MKKLIKTLQKAVSAALLAADIDTYDKINNAIADFFENICYELGRPIAVESNLKGYRYFSCYISTDDSRPGVDPRLYISIDYGKFFYPGVDDTNFTSDTEILYRIGKNKEDCSKAPNQYAKLADMGRIIDDFYLKSIKPCIEDEDGNLIFNLKKSGCTTEELSKVLYGVYLEESEVCIDEFLNSVEIRGASINEVTYIFARLHELADNDDTWICRDDDTVALVDYLP